MKLRHALLPLCLLAALPSLATARGFDVRDMVKLDRVSAPLLTANGAQVVFTKRVVDADLKASSSLWIRDLRTRDLAPPRQFSPEGWNLNSAALSADGMVGFVGGDGALLRSGPLLRRWSPVGRPPPGWSGHRPRPG